MRSVVVVGAGAAGAGIGVQYLAMPVHLALLRTVVPGYEYVWLSNEQMALALAVRAGVAGAVLLVAGCLVGAAAPSYPVRHAAAAGFLFVTLVTAYDFRYGLPTPFGWAVSLGSVVILTAAAAAGGWAAVRLAGAMRWGRSVVAVGVGAGAVVVCFDGLATWLWPMVRHLLRPGWQADPAAWPEATHPVAYELVKLAMLGIPFLLGGLLTAATAPGRRVQHALATGVLVGLLGVVLGMRSRAAPTLAGTAASAAGLLVFVSAAAAIGGWRAEVLAAQRSARGRPGAEPPLQGPPGRAGDPDVGDTRVE